MRCPACGDELVIKEREVLPETLCRQWALTDDERLVINRREGDICSQCGNSLRLLGFAETVLTVLRERFGVHASRFEDVSDALRNAGGPLAIWECNNLSVLHSCIRNALGVVYTEYGSRVPEVPSEDLMALRFPGNSFDLILMTDVLEHVPDLEQALRELERVLKEDGRIIMTVPVLMNRKTRQRAVLGRDGGVEHLLEPSFHGSPGVQADDLLVVHEFGGDVTELLERIFAVTCFNEGELPYGANTVFVLQKKRKSSMSSDLEDQILKTKWFYPFQLPSGHVTKPYVPESVAVIHDTRREMMLSVLDPIFSGRWETTRCVDLACNQGYYSMLLAQKGAEVIGIEARQETVDEAILMRDCLGLSNASYVQGDVMALSAEDYEPFEVVLMLGLIYHLENPVGALRVAKALTKGVLLVESQVGPDLNAKIDWGTSAMQQQICGTFCLIDETEQFANPLGSVTGIALCPSPGAIVWILRALGFARVEILPVPENAYEQFVAGNRVMIAAYTDEYLPEDA